MHDDDDGLKKAKKIVRFSHYFNDPPFILSFLFLFSSAGPPARLTTLL